MSTLDCRRGTSAKLPLEICEFIIGFVHPGPAWYKDYERRGFLRPCLLVCRDWVPKSRIELYRFIELDDKTRAMNFVATITSFPSLGEYVQSLRFDGGFDSRRECGNWFYKVHQALQSRLPNLTFLEYFYPPVVHPSFFVLPSQFDSIRCLRLRYLCWWSLRETMRLLRRFAQLEELVIDSCDWGTHIPSSVYCRQTNWQNPPKAIAPRLELREDPWYQGMARDVVIGWLTRSHLSFSLCSLKLEMDVTTSESFCDLLSQCSGTLESIQFVFPDWGDYSAMTCTQCLLPSFPWSNDSL